MTNPLMRIVRYLTRRSINQGENCVDHILFDDNFGGVMKTTTTTSMSTEQTDDARSMNATETNNDSVNNTDVSLMSYLYDANPNNRTSLLESGDTQQQQQQQSSSGSTLQDDIDVPFPSFWDLLLTLYIPILIQSVFGTLYVARSILLGYGLPYVCHFIFVLTSKIEKSTQWQKLLQHFSTKAIAGVVDESSNAPSFPTASTIGMAAATASAVDPGYNGSFCMWQHRTNNPPAFIAVLAILTIATLIVHPDGHTWILFRKTR
jgi:hypothetical protein